MLTIFLLTLSNVFMTFAWYYHLKSPMLRSAPMWCVILASWAIAFFEYCFQVPANRLGNRSGITPPQLKIMQEAITLVVFCVFARFVLKEKIAWNYYVGFAFVMAGVFFVFHFKPADSLSSAAHSTSPSAPIVQAAANPLHSPHQKEL